VGTLAKRARARARMRVLLSISIHLAVDKSSARALIKMQTITRSPIIGCSVATILMIANARISNLNRLEIEISPTLRYLQRGSNDGSLKILHEVSLEINTLLQIAIDKSLLRTLLGKFPRSTLVACSIVIN